MSGKNHLHEFKQNKATKDTVSGNIVYMHVYRWPGTELIATMIDNKVTRVRFMNGRDIDFRQTPDQIFLTGLPGEPPEPLTTVIEFHCDGTPRYRPGFHDLPAHMTPETLYA